MSNRPIKATTGAVIEKEGRILLTKRNIEPFKGTWCIPGGHIELNENAEDAIAREVKEETGLDFKPKFLFYNNEIVKDIGWHAVVLVFTGDVSGKEKMCEKEVIEMRWFMPNEIKKLDMAFRHKEIVYKFLEEKKC